MAAIYIRWIQAGRMTLDEVPAKWRIQVAVALTEAGQGNKVIG